MKFGRPARKNAKRPAAFTLAEVLAAMVFMAIVIPVAVEGLRVASLAGEVAQRKMVAVRLGNNLLNELKVSGRLTGSTQRGVQHENGLDYTWNVRTENWAEDTLNPMTLATIKVSFPAQNKQYEVDLSTLVARTP